MGTAGYHRAVEISKIRQYMKYGPSQYKTDWELSIALSQLMAVNGCQPHLEVMLESCFMRILAYISNNPEEVPW